MSEYSAILAAQVDLLLKRGDKAVLTIYLTDPNDSDNPFDLSGFAEMTMHIKFRRESASVLKELTLTGGGLAVTGPSSNGLQIVLTDADTDLNGREYFYDVETDDDQTILEGKVKLFEDVTKIATG